MDEIYLNFNLANCKLVLYIWYYPFIINIAVKKIIKKAKNKTYWNIKQNRSKLSKLFMVLAGFSSSLVQEALTGTFQMRIVLKKMLKYSGPFSVIITFWVLRKLSKQVSIFLELLFFFSEDFSSARLFV